MINSLSRLLTSKKPSMFAAFVWIALIITGTTLAVTAIPLAHFLKSLYLTKKKVTDVILKL